MLILALLAPWPIEDVQKFMAAHATNPAAVQFQQMRVVEDVVCGEINLPNRFGGYDGFKPFAFRGPRDWTHRSENFYAVGSDGGWYDTAQLFEAQRVEYTVASDHSLELLAACSGAPKL